MTPKKSKNAWHAVPDGAGAPDGPHAGRTATNRMWAEFDRISPIGDVRGDILNAQLVSAVYGSQCVKVTFEDAQLKWSTEEDEISDSSDPFAGLEAALSAAAR